MGSDLQDIFSLAAKYFYKKYKKGGGSQAIIAKKLGINQSYVSAVINGTKTASLELQSQIADILYGPFEEFLTIGRRIQNNLDPEINDQLQPEKGVEKLIAQLTHYVMDHQRIEKELVSTKKFYEDIVQNLQARVVVTDKDDKIFFVNHFMFNTSGISKDILIGVNIFSAQDKFPKIGYEEFLHNYNKAKESLRPLFYENIRVVTPIGRQAYFSGWMIPKLTNGQYDGMTCTIRDTTRAQDLTMLLRVTLDNSPNAIGITKMRAESGSIGITYFTNRKMRQLFGQKETDYKEITIQESLNRCEKYIVNNTEWRNFLDKHLKRGTKGSLIITHTNGKQYRWTSENLLDFEGRPWGRMATVMEVGHKRRKGDQ